MAELARTGVLERTGGGAAGETFVDEPDLRVRVVDAAQIVIAVHLETPGGAPPRMLLDAAAGVTGHALPMVPNTRSGDDDEYTVWLDPARWLVVSAVGQRWSRLRELEAALAAATPEALASDSTDALVVLDIAGARAEALMTMACALDIDSRTFAAPRTARAGFAGAGGSLLYRHRNGFRVHFDATLTAHVREWLGEAGRLLPRPGR